MHSLTDLAARTEAVTRFDGDISKASCADIKAWDKSVDDAVDFEIRAHTQIMSKRAKRKIEFALRAAEFLNTSDLHTDCEYCGTLYEPENGHEDGRIEHQACSQECADHVVQQAAHEDSYRAPR